MSDRVKYENEVWETIGVIECPGWYLFKDPTKCLKAKNFSPSRAGKKFEFFAVVDGVMVDNAHYIVEGFSGRPFEVRRDKDGSVVEVRIRFED